jgi:hypothetical protein
MERRRKKSVRRLELGKMAIRGNRTVQEQHRRRTLSITGRCEPLFLKSFFLFPPNSSRFDSFSTGDHQDERGVEHIVVFFLLTRRQQGG